MQKFFISVRCIDIPILIFYAFQLETFSIKWQISSVWCDWLNLEARRFVLRGNAHQLVSSQCSLGLQHETYVELSALIYGLKPSLYVFDIGFEEN